MGKFLTAVMITALIVGGGVYLWQKTRGEDMLNQLKNASENIKGELEGKLSRLESEVTGLKQENESLKTANTELESKAKLLSDAKKEFSSAEYGIQFEYPAEYGEVKIETALGSAGASYIGTFSQAPSLVFGGVSTDYSSAGEPVFTDLQNIEKKREGSAEAISAKFGGGPKALSFAVKPLKIIAGGAGDILVVNSGSFPPAASVKSASATSSASAATTTPAGIPETVAPGETGLGALVTLKKDKFKALAFIAADTDKVAPETLEKILKSLSVR